MKFAKYLAAEAVPEWQRKYINYRGLKKRIKAVKAAKDAHQEALLRRQESLLRRALSQSKVRQSLPLVPEMTELPREPVSETESFQPLVKDTTKVVDDVPSSAGMMEAPAQAQSQPQIGWKQIIDKEAPAHLDTLTSAERIDLILNILGQIERQSKKSSSEISILSATPENEVPANASSSGINIRPGSRNRSRSKLRQIPTPKTKRSDYLPQEIEFFEALEAELTKIEEFFKEKETYAVETICELREQCNLYHLTRSQQKQNLHQPSSVLASNPMSDASPKHTDLHAVSSLPSQSTADTAQTVVESPLLQIKQRLKRMIPTSLPNLSNLSHKSKTPKKSQVQIDSPDSPNENADLYPHDGGYIDIDNARRKIKVAFLEFYRFLELLKNFKLLNHTGLAKILKKHDKLTGHLCMEPYMYLISKTHFWASPVLDQLIKDTEDLFASFSGDRQTAMQKLRLPNFKAQTHHATVYRLGLYMGATIFPVVYTISQLIKTPVEAQYYPLIQLFGAFTIPIFMLFLFGLALRIYSRHNINYIFIFEFDPRDHLAVYQFMEIAGLLLVWWAFCFYAALGRIEWFPNEYWSAIFAGVVLLAIIFPFNTFYRSARLWIMRTLGRIFVSGYWRIEFRDFFITDLLISMGYMFLGIYLLFCVNIRCEEDEYDETTCAPEKVWIPSICMGLPSFWRLCQSLRRYVDSNYTTLHAVNAGKYTASLLVVVLSGVMKVHDTTAALWAWILASIVATCYSWSWDIFHDFGFCWTSKNGWLLRDELAYSWRWFYRFVLVNNTLLRLTWVILISPAVWDDLVDSRIMVYILVLLEVFRRFVWALVRMENEHLNNCGRFRATRDIPLPFMNSRVAIRVDSGDDDEDDVLPPMSSRSQRTPSLRISLVDESKFNVLRTQVTSTSLPVSETHGHVGLHRKRSLVRKQTYPDTTEFS